MYMIKTKGPFLRMKRRMKITLIIFKIKKAKNRKVLLREKHFKCQILKL